MEHTRDFRFPPKCSWGLYPSGMSASVCWWYRGLIHQHTQSPPYCAEVAHKLAHLVRCSIQCWWVSGLMRYRIYSFAVKSRQLLWHLCYAGDRALQALQQSPLTAVGQARIPICIYDTVVHLVTYRCILSCIPTASQGHFARLHQRLTKNDNQQQRQQQQGI
jgi:hypothetical protein